MTKCLRSFFGTRAFPQWGQRSFTEEKRLSSGENLEAQTLQRSWPLEPLFLCRKGFGALHRGAGAGVWDITFGPAADRADLLAIAFFVVRDTFLVSPVLSEIGNKGELINLELLVFWGIGIIKSPLPEGDISADEVNQPAVLLIKILNNRK